MRKRLMKQFLAIAFICSIHISFFAQGHEDRFNSIDVLQYTFQVELNDDSEHIKGVATILISFKSHWTGSG